MLNSFGPISTLPGYNPNATYLPPGSALPSSYPERQSQPVSFAPQSLPRVVDNQTIGGGGAGGAANSITENGNSYNGLVASVASGFPGDIWKDVNFSDFAGLGNGTVNNGPGAFNFSSPRDFISSLADHPASGLPALPTQSDLKGWSTPFGWIDQNDVLSGAATLAGQFIPGLGPLMSLYNFGSGVSTGLDKAKYGDTNTAKSIGTDANGGMSNYTDQESLLHKLFHPAATLGDLTGQGVGALLGLGQSPIEANPFAALIPKNPQLTGPSNDQYSGQAFLPHMLTGPSSDQYNGKPADGFDSLAHAYSGISFNPSNPGGYDPEMAAKNWQTLINNTTLSPTSQAAAGMGIERSSIPLPSSPFSMTGDMMAPNGFMMGASWGGPGYGYGDAQPYNDPGNTEEIWFNGMVGGPPKGNQTT